MRNAISSDGDRQSSPRGKAYLDPRQDPVAFVRQVLRESPYDKQIEILGAVESSRRVSVVGCNGSGKDWAAARSVLWWMHSREPAKALVTGPTTRQVDDIVWNEMRIAYGGAADALGGRMFRTSRYEVGEQSFALGFATNSPYNLQGFHSPNLLVVITEAHAMREPDVDAIRRLNPLRLLMTGNPFVTAGAFYDSHHTMKNLYATVQISAFDTPNLKAGGRYVEGMINQRDIDDRKDEWGEDSPLYIGAVLGEFPDNLDGVVVPLWAAAAAGKRSMEADGPLIVACDVARYGHDKTVVMRRQGNVARIVRRTRGNDTMDTANFLKSYCDDHEAETVVVDDIGIGAGVVDRLKEMGFRRTRLMPFIAGEKADDPKHFRNRITEVWWDMRKRYLEEALDTDDDGALIGQVSSRAYEILENGQTALAHKRNLAQSPDEADALAMTFATLRRGVKIWV